MSWFSNIVNNAVGWGGEDPVAIQQRQNAANAAAAEAQRQQEQEAAQQQATQTNQPAAAPAPYVPPAYSGPSAIQKLESLLPIGFDQSRLPGTYDDPFIEQQYGRARGSAEGLIANMLRRGTITESGRNAGISALDTQSPGIRTKLSGIGDLMLENERGKLRGIANTGREATTGQSGEFFDPNPYGQQVDTELGRFQGAFPGEFGTAAGGVNFDTAGIGSATGAAAGGGRGEPFDPYAASGGNLKTGLEEGKGQPQKKRSTAVF